MVSRSGRRVLVVHLDRAHPRPQGAWLDRHLLPRGDLPGGERPRDHRADSLERETAIDVQDQRGVSALHACAMHGLLGCARALKARGANLDQTDLLGRSAGEIAALLGFVDVAAELGVERAPIPSVRQTLRRPARAPD